MYQRNNKPFTSEDQKFFLSPLYWIETVMEEQDETTEYVNKKYVNKKYGGQDDN